MQLPLSKTIHSIEDIHCDIEKIVQSITGDVNRDELCKFVHQSWDSGHILFCIEECYHPSLQLIHSLDKDKRFQTNPYYLPDQVPSTSTLLYNKQFAARLIHDGTDEKSSYAKFSEYNIEPHYHEVDSIIITTSNHKCREAEFMIHDTRPGFDVVIKIPLKFGSFVCFPRFVNHTFLPSDVGLSTLTITDRYIEPRTQGFSHPSKCDFDKMKIISYSDYQTLLIASNFGNS